MNIPKKILPLPSLKKSRTQIFNRITRNIFQSACKRNGPHAEQQKQPMERQTIETEHISTVSSLGKMHLQIFACSVVVNSSFTYPNIKRLHRWYTNKSLLCHQQSINRFILLFNSVNPLFTVDRTEESAPSTFKVDCQRDNYGLYALKFSRSVAKRSDVMLNEIDDNVTMDRCRSNARQTGHGSINGRSLLPKPYARATDKHEYFEPCQSYAESQQTNRKARIPTEDNHDDENDIDEYYQIEFNETRGIRDMKKYRRAPIVGPKTATNSINVNRMSGDRNANDGNCAMFQRPPPPPPPLPPKRTRNLT